MGIPTAGRWVRAEAQVLPSSSLTDFTLLIDWSQFSAEHLSYLFADVNTSDGARARVTNLVGVELPFDWFNLVDEATPGITRIKYAGTLPSTGTVGVIVYAPNTRNTSYATSDPYGQYNAYSSDWIGYWPLVEDFNDRTGNQYNGTGSGGITAGGVSGQAGNATDFNGTDQYVEVMGTSEDPLAGASEAYISAYAKPDSLTSDQRLMSRWDTTNQFLLWMDAGGASNGWASAVRLSTQSLIVAGTDDATASLNWQSVAMSFSSTDALRVYTDNVAGDTVSANSTLNGVSELTLIGASSLAGGGDYFNGAIQHALMLDTVPSSSWQTEEYEQLSDNATFWGNITHGELGGGGIVILRRRIEGM